jgi:polyisoprenoid-binding protein YceI
MAVTPGHYRLGPQTGRLILRTFRDGLAARAGHDLIIEVTRWSGDLTIGDDQAPTGFEASIDLNSLAVREGTGGVKPLTDRDRREIAVTAGKVLGTNRNPEATFTADGFQQSGGGWTISGTLALAGQTGPLRVQVSEAGQDRWRATASVVQTSFGIKPYTGFMGALRLRDTVEVEAEGGLPEPEGGS